MNERIQISAKNLGALALTSYCPRCFWVRMKCGNTLPFQIFPGIFSSIDSYSKKVTIAHFRHRGYVPRWFDRFGKLGAPVRVPGWSKFQMHDPETNIVLTGVPDEILRHQENGAWILDYKTARFTDKQDSLAPMYEVQLNCYGLIATKIGLGPVCGLGLLYYEPITDLELNDADFLIRDDSFFMEFSPKIQVVRLQQTIIPPLLRRVREICNLADCPAGRAGCRDCERLDVLAQALNRDLDREVLATLTRATICTPTGNRKSSGSDHQ